MLLDDFDNNPAFRSGGEGISTEFEKEVISLQLATDQGRKPLISERIGEWQLRAKRDLTVSIILILLSHTLTALSVYLIIGVYEGGDHVFLHQRGKAKGLSA